MPPTGIITLDRILKITGQFDPLTVTILELAEQGLEEIDRSIGLCENTIWLDLSGNRISRGLDVLRRLSCLAYLDLSNNRLSEVKNAALAGKVSDLAGFSGCSHLENISLRRCPLVEQVSFATLASNLKAVVPSLRRLNGVNIVEVDKMPLDAAPEASGSSQATDEYLAKTRLELSRPWIDDAVNELRSRRFESKNMRMIDELLCAGEARPRMPSPGAFDEAKVAGSMTSAGLYDDRCENTRGRLSLHREVASLSTEDLLSSLCLELLGPRAKAELVGHARALLHREIDNFDGREPDTHKWEKAFPLAESRCGRTSSSSTVTSLAIHSAEDTARDVCSGTTWWLAEELLPHVLSFIVEVGENLRSIRAVCRAFNTATRLPQCYQGSHVYLSSGACKAVDPEAHWMKVLELPLEQAASITVGTLGVPVHHLELLSDTFGTDKVVRHMTGFAREVHSANIEWVDEHTVRRKDEHDPFLAIVLGNAPLRRLACGDYYFAFRIAKTSRRHFGGGVTIALTINPPLQSIPEKLRGPDVTLAIVQKGEVFVYGEKIETRFLYWNASSLKEGDVVGLRIDWEGTITLYRNDRIVPTTAPLQIADLGVPPQQLLPGVDQPSIYAMLHVKANTTAVTLLPDHEPPHDDKFWLSEG
ncbi:Splicing factor 3B subunit 1, partial [Perkinsus olseni]